MRNEGLLVTGCSLIVVRWAQIFFSKRNYLARVQRTAILRCAAPPRHTYPLKIYQYFAALRLWGIYFKTKKGLEQFGFEPFLIFALSKRQPKTDIQF